jgi:hypothetical protein
LPRKDRNKGHSISMSTIFVQSGQCGNQLGFQLLTDLFQQIHAGHNTSSSSSNSRNGTDECAVEDELEIFFRESETKPGRYSARCVCLDTEPKVINEIVEKAKAMHGPYTGKLADNKKKHSAKSSSRSTNNADASAAPVNTNGKRWAFDKSSIAYRHGGAGNNWAVGYEMCSGEYLEMAMDCVRRELERCFRPAANIVVVHGVAGGTGSGLGTKMTEEIADQFRGGSNVSIANIAITPYHFGEVVVQHYNALLCLSKISAASDGVILFENETAQELCKYMRRLDRPTLNDINKVISSNIVPVLLPKRIIGRGSDSGAKCSLADDLEHLCCHPGYKFLDIKMTPQTSESAVSFTCDSWNTLISTITKMQIKGTASERGLGSLRLFDINTSSPCSGSAHSSSSSSSRHNAAGTGASAGSTMCKSLASVLTLFGDDAESVARNIQYHQEDQLPLPIERSPQGKAVNAKMAAAPPSVPSSSSSSVHPPLFHDDSDGIDPIRTFFLAPYSELLYSSSSMLNYPVRTCVSSHGHINGYQRSACLLSNGCTVLPLLTRVCVKSAQLYEHNAFTHCYSRNGVEEDDFVAAFRNIGQVISNYGAIK